MEILVIQIVRYYLVFLIRKTNIKKLLRMSICIQILIDYQLIISGHHEDHHKLFSSSPQQYSGRREQMEKHNFLASSLVPFLNSRFLF